MKRSQAFPSTYLGKDDVPTPIVAVIGEVGIESINGDNGKEDKAVMHFADENLKPMIVNGTNWDIIAAAYGDDSDDWTGKRIKIYVDPNVMFGKKKVGGLRVKIPTVAAAPAARGPVRQGKPQPAEWTDQDGAEVGDEGPPGPADSDDTPDFA